MKFRIDKQIIIENESSGALGDDFSFKDNKAVQLLINDISSVLSGQNEDVVIYGAMCYKIHVSKNESTIYCYDEFLGNEASLEIFKMFKAWFEFLESPE